jgi:hypothetical protein
MRCLINSILKYRDYLFVLLLVLLYFSLDYHSILFLRPQGIHFMRQTDCLSFAVNYYEHGYHFFQPQVFNLQSDGGRAVGEFPILYYLTALLYGLFGEHEFILRLLTLVISSVGFLYLFKLLYRVLRDVTFAFAFSFLFISSTVLLYYTNNYLPDASALGLTLIGWYYFFIFLENRSRRNSLYVCFFFFALASLIKVTFFINPIAAIISLLVYDFSRDRNMKSLFSENAAPMLIFAFSLLIIVSWNYFAIIYNRANHVDSFLMQSTPIWGIGEKQIGEVWEYMSNYWYTRYYYPSTLHFFLVLLLAGIVFVNKSERILLILSLMLAAGSISYFLLFYSQFKDHDYYFIALIPGVIFITVNAFVSVRNKFPLYLSSYPAKLLLIGLCILSLNYAHKKLNQRYEKTDDGISDIGTRLATTRHFLDSTGVPENAKIIIVTDKTPNGGLYFIHRPGWSIKDTTEASKEKLDRYIGMGADYILFTDVKYSKIRFNGVKAGEDSGVMLYKLARELTE